ncbi:tRNA (guanosine(46)-N7)-methyltransferase TrmB [Brochothrix thermosphacta]|uniref:tRNA (guanosine(46)-N7)-methyltransferase TrmB n=1 Tax=Brochothrix thermosphacta TaxID=2756 RepID=UPI000EBB9F66|nr:tRNA (guanosine(46)-N7)-methyltransferase TrmB [Brochothrix thermosphacta]HCZ38178.1 tRNA (guanosine(46)-N7)-methyltransferase TrmB [Brochothrix thermosphacta]HCZ45905.1 tRNA (guanosine(46)-N7)-methyltransferase TrmB [Brochothrix thermosphacta]
MRLRNKPWAQEKLESHPEHVIMKPEEMKGKWSQLFGNDQPIHIEIGTGKGQFITGMAELHPDINYLGIEIQKSVMIDVLDKIIDKKLTNIKLLPTDGALVSEFFEKGEIDQVYLNFSDPWPKKRHEKRRLTSAPFLTSYKDVLETGKELHFKTDNRGLFEYSLISFTNFGLSLEYLSLDLHQSEMEGNVQTEYEQKFSAKGQPIYRCEVQFK